jgi:hypothetical protein
MVIRDWILDIRYWWSYLSISLIFNVQINKEIRVKPSLICKLFVRSIIQSHQSLPGSNRHSFGAVPYPQFCED